MGEDDIVFHAGSAHHAARLQRPGQPERHPGSLGALDLPTEVVSSEFLAMRAMSSPPPATSSIYVRDFPGPLRHGRATLLRGDSRAGDAGHRLHLERFVRRNNDELVATWGDLVNRSVSFAAGRRPDPRARRELTDTDHGILERSRRSFGSSGVTSSASHFEAAITATIRTSPRRTSTCPTGAVEAARVRPRRIRPSCHVGPPARGRHEDPAHPVPPRSSAKVPRDPRRAGTVGPGRRGQRVDKDGATSYPVITGDYDSPARSKSEPIRPASRCRGPAAVRQLDPSVVDEELARLEQS